MKEQLYIIQNIQADETDYSNELNKALVTYCEERFEVFDGDLKVTKLESEDAALKRLAEMVIFWMKMSNEKAEKLKHIGVIIPTVEKLIEEAKGTNDE